MACGRPHRTFEHTSYELSDPLNKPAIDLQDFLDRSAQQTLIAEGVDKPSNPLALFVN
jgi:hypothetical protein